MGVENGRNLKDGARSVIKFYLRIERTIGMRVGARLIVFGVP